VLDLGEERLPETGLRLGHPLVVESASGSAEAVFARTFADVGARRLLLYVDSYGSLALAVNRGSAAAELRLVPGDEVVLRPG
jgi:S-adenosylmethionine hydrolase